MNVQAHQLSTMPNSPDPGQPQKFLLASLPQALLRSETLQIESDMPYFSHKLWDHKTMHRLLKAFPYSGIFGCRAWLLHKVAVISAETLDAALSTLKRANIMRPGACA